MVVTYKMIGWGIDFQFFWRMLLCRFAFRCQSCAFLHSSHLTSVNTSHRALQRSVFAKRQPCIWMTIDQLNKPFKCFLSPHNQQCHWPGSAKCIMPIVFHQSADIYMRSLSTQRVLWLVEVANVVFSSFSHVSTVLEVTYELGTIVFNRILARLPSRASHWYQLLFEENLEEVCWFANANVGRRDFAWEPIRMEDCIFNRDVVKWKNTTIAYTWFYNLREWRGPEQTTLIVQSRSTLMKTNFVLAGVDPR